MRCATIILMLALPISTAVLRADNSNNYINPPRTLPTPYGLKIVRSSDVRVAEAESELPVAGLSLGRYLESIEAAEIAGGAYSAELAEPLDGMGRAYQANDKHPEAMNFFKRALHLSRINEGLYSANQLPALEGMINSQMAMGQLSKVDETQAYRYRVQRHVYEAGDPGLLDATLEYSEWQRTAYLDGLGGETYLRLLDIHDMYSREIERIQAQDANSAALIPHLNQRMRAEYLLSQYEGEKQPEFQINVTSGMEAQFALNTNLDMERFRMLKKNNFRNGRKSLEQIAELLAAQEPPDRLALARAKIALGDWYLWWDRLARALQSYRAAYAVLEEGGAPGADPQSLFGEPVELPEEPIFHPGAISIPASRQAKAVVLFNISRVGRVKEFEIVELEPAGDMGARIALTDMMREIRFRPHVRNGEIAAVESMVREYTFEY